LAKLIIDGVVHAAAVGGGPRQVLRYLAMEFALVVLADVLLRASSLAETLLGDLLANQMNIVIMEKSATLDLQQFEDATFQDRLDRAMRATGDRLGLLGMVLTFLQDLLTLVAFTTALATQSPALLLLLVLSVIPGFLGETYFATRAYSLQFRMTPRRRQLDYLRVIGASNVTVKEVQLFDLAPWLIGRYRTLVNELYQLRKNLGVRRTRVNAALNLLTTVASYSATIVYVLRAVAGAISIGTMSFLMGSFARARSLIGSLLGGIGAMYEQTLYLHNLFDFLDAQPAITSPPGAIAVPEPIRHGFVFEHVGFQYPGAEGWALRDFCAHIGPGERVALVGENGAGKTTITKLIARLYDPTEGRILLDGVDLREYDLTSLRRAIGVIFQDFVRYQFRFDENIGVGNIESIREYIDADPSWRIADDEGVPRRGKAVETPPAPREVPRAITVAAEKSFADSLLPRLPAGYRQMLGRRFQDGIDLSGGEWQRVALARAYMRDAQLMILDEPTAALDARSEHDVFVRFNALMEDRMAIVISHRFSTVRMADRILVLSRGALVEEGTHHALVEQGGLYAELFGLQAAGYR
jgi:ATP-binding cassette subfamily B protein